MHLHATVSKDGHEHQSCLHPSRRIAVAEWRPLCPQDEVGILFAICSLDPARSLPIVQAYGNIAGGQVRALGVTGAASFNSVPRASDPSRRPAFPQQYGLVAPAGTPRPVIEALNKALRSALTADEVRKRLAADGAESTPSTPEEHALLIEQ